ncbi:MAG TPA: DNA mismatch repair protein MutT [Deltaproteobacteria bacterium]|jgi:ADP-ribose pyrophosphatase YjhB (NUDIX family)|nr:DNA mismatch repair protein MutT [Deltaproteobacteria bacterium]
MQEAVVAVVTMATKILFIRRGPGVPHTGYWAPPSGNIEPGEDQATAVVREVREEVGLTVKPLRMVWECVSASGTHLLSWWLADWVSGELRLDPREVSEARWLTPHEIAALEPTFEKDREFFEKVLPRLQEP